MYNLRIVWRDGHESHFTIPREHVSDVYQKIAPMNEEVVRIVWPNERGILIFSWNQVNALEFSEVNQG